jgi:hypothetical protein
MKNERKHAWLFVQVLVMAVLLLIAAPGLLAQASGSSSGSGGGSNNPATNFNPPPCDFQDFFYNNVGISTSNVGTTPETAQGVDSVPAQRFGLFRQFGPPAIFRGQANWVVDNNNCTSRDPIRKNIRILATTAGYVDDGLGSPTDFISIIAFLTNQSFFETNFVSGDPAFDCSVPTPPNLPTSGCVVITNGNSQVTLPVTGVGGATGAGAVGFGLNARNNGPGNTGVGPQGISGFGVGSGQGDDMQDIVSNFEAYPAVKQRLANGTFAPVPCGSLDTLANNPNTLNPALPFNPPSNCFSQASVATPNLRQDWRFATNRNAIDGSDNNNVTGSGATGVINNNSPYGYFCDDLLGMWINTYWWFTQDPGMTNGPCSQIYANIAAVEGTSLDGTPIVKTADELNNQLEANGCGQEGKLDFGGADGGAVWLICPAIADPTNGAITLDAFLDQVRQPNGFPLDPRFTINFFCLQFFGQTCSNLTAAQVRSAQSQGASAQAAAASAAASSSSSN